jgi:hypothetical protein
MKKGFSFLVLLECFYSSIGGLAADVESGKANPQAGAPRFYPWSDASPYVRLPKSLLPELNILSVTISNYETMEFVITEAFVNLCAVTPAERTKLTDAVTTARHEYYTAKAKGWASTDEKAHLRGWESTVLERFDFKQEPIPETRAAIYQALQQQILAILGEERARYFWDFSGMLDSEDIGFGREFEAPPPGEKRSTIYTFLLRKGELGLELDLFTTTVSSGTGHRGGGGGGGPYAQPFDQYAPESMRPVLARWRKAVAEANTNKIQTGTSTHRPSAREAESQTTPQRNNRPAIPPAPGDSAVAIAKWQNGSSYVDVPKTAIPLLRIAGLNMDQEISDEAVILFGLTGSERRGIDKLHKRMKARFEKLERSHFERTQATENSFVIRAFPDQAKKLQGEWSRSLGGIVGIERAAFLDDAIRTPSTCKWRRSATGVDDMYLLRMEIERGLDWLQRGMAETQFDLMVNAGPDGRPAVQQFQWKGEGRDIGNAGSVGPIPERWRHLLTLDKLKPATGGR